MIFLVELVRNGIEICVGGHRGMEGVVENGHLRNGGHQVVDGTNAFQVASVMNRCEVAQTLYASLNTLVHEATLLEEVAALHNTVTNSVDFIEALDGAILFVEQCLEHEVHTLFMVGHVVHQDFLLAVGQSQFQEGVVKSDALHATLCQHRLIVHVVKFVLDGTTSAVQD